MNIWPRSTILLPEPPATRPKLRQGITELLVHYTGVNGYPANPLRDFEYAKSVAYYGMNRDPAIPYEYNYLIGPGGNIFEQAGDFKGAHCLNWNNDSYGILMMLGINVAPTTAMIASYWELVDYLISTGQLDEDFTELPHYARRATGCCGITLAEAPHGVRPSPTGQGSLGDLIPSLREPIIVPPPPPLPTPPKGGTVFTGLVKFHTHAAWYACYSDGTKKWIAPGSGDEFRALLQLAGFGTEMGVHTNAELFRAFGPIIGPVPDGVDAYGIPVA